MLDALIWYLLAVLAGAVAFPLAFRFFPALADRGYTVSRALGLLLWGYLFWMLSTLGVLVNTPGGVLAALALLAGVSYWAWRGIDREALGTWWKEKRRLLITVEVLFAAAYIFMALMRAMEPAALGTEKPMELAFINAFLRSPAMPPLDPWLADYAISYYYFGYVIVGMLAKLGGIAGGVAFNLGITLVFALAAVGAYGLVYNLLAGLDLEISKRRLLGLPLLGPLFVLVLSNVEGFLEFIHGRGAFWTQTASGEWTSKFWAWINIEDLILPPPGNTAPGALRHWWWWRASRVIYDFDLAGNRMTVSPIDEFPFFSFFLADLHPHVLVIPFVLLALAFSLNMFLQAGKPGAGRFKLYRFEFLFSPQSLVLGTLIFGGLGFLNLWDFPWYVGVFAAAHLLRKVDELGWSMDRVIEFVLLGLAFGVAGVLAYLPFYLSFSSQAGGIMPNVIHPTRGIYMWVMFGTLFLPLFGFLAYLAFRRRNSRSLLSGLLAALLLVALLLGFSVLMTNSLSSPDLPGLNDGSGNLFLRSYSAESAGQLISEGLGRRVQTWFTSLTLIALLGLGVGLLWPAQTRIEETALEEARTEKVVDSHRFAVVMIVFAGLLVLIPEYFYLRDQFGVRMNTIFKFYYQAWILWALAGAYGSAVLFSRPLKTLAAKLFPAFFVIALVIGMTYPLMAVDTRISTFNAQLEPVLTLDGAANNFYLDPDEQAAAEWLRQAPVGTLAEAIHPTGGSYTHYARISMNTGQPAVLGWIGHESQWRGGMAEVGSRQADIERLYTTGSWEEARQIIEQYGIVYIVVGNLERSTYNLYEDKFIRNLEPAFQQGGLTIYYTGITP